MNREEAYRIVKYYYRELRKARFYKDAEAEAEAYAKLKAAQAVWQSLPKK